MPDYPASLKTSSILEVRETVADYSHEVKENFKIMESNVKESVLCETKEMEKRFEKVVEETFETVADYSDEVKESLKIMENNVKETVRHETKEMKKQFEKVVKETVQQELEKRFEKRGPPSTTSSTSLQ